MPAVCRLDTGVKKLSVFQKKLSHYYWLAIRCTVSVVAI